MASGLTVSRSSSFLRPNTLKEATGPGGVTVIADVGSSGTRFYKYVLNATKELVGGKLGSLSRACNKPESKGCTEMIESMVGKLKDVARDSGALAGVHILGTAGLRQVNPKLKTKICEKLMRAIKHTFPDVPKTETRSIAGFEEAETEFLAVNNLMAKEGWMGGELKKVPGGRGYFGMGGASVQFGLKTSEGAILLQSYPYGMSVARETLSKDGRVGAHCEFNEPGTNDRGVMCLQAIGEVFGREKSLRDEVDKSKPKPTEDQWGSADLIAVANFYLVQDFLLYHENPKLYEQVKDEDRKNKVNSPVTRKWLAESARKLCNLTLNEAMKPTGANKKHPKWDTEAFVRPACFKATYIAHVLGALGVPENKPIYFRSHIAAEEVEWTLGVYERVERGFEVQGFTNIQKGCDRVENFAQASTCLCGTSICKAGEHSSCDVFGPTGKECS